MQGKNFRAKERRQNDLELELELEAHQELLEEARCNLEKEGDVRMQDAIRQEEENYIRKRARTVALLQRALQEEEAFIHKRTRIAALLQRALLDAIAKT